MSALCKKQTSSYWVAPPFGDLLAVSLGHEARRKGPSLSNLTRASQDRLRTVETVPSRWSSFRLSCASQFCLCIAVLSPFWRVEGHSQPHPVVGDELRAADHPEAEGGASLNEQLHLANRLPVETVLDFDAKQVCTRWHIGVGHIDAFAGHIFA